MYEATEKDFKEIRPVSQKNIAIIFIRLGMQTETSLKKSFNMAKKQVVVFIDHNPIYVVLCRDQIWDVNM